MSDGVTRNDVDDPTDRLLQMFGKISQELDTFSSHSDPDKRERARRRIERLVDKIEAQLLENEDHYAEFLETLHRYNTDPSSIDPELVEQIEDRESKFLRSYGIYHSDFQDLAALYREHRRRSPENQTASQATRDVRAFAEFVDELVHNALDEIDAARQEPWRKKVDLKDEIMMSVLFVLGGTALVAGNEFVGSPVREASWSAGGGLWKEAITGWWP